MKSNICSKLTEEIYKCSKCGLCKSVCPIFLLTKNEMYSPRGRYILLNNILKNYSKPSAEFIKNLDFCLNCNVCKKFCPSNIDTDKILTVFKNFYNFKYSLFSFSFLYYLYLIFLKILSLFRFFIPFKSKYYRNMFYVKVKRRRTFVRKSKTIIFFEGCFNKYINPSDKNAASNIIESLGYKIKYISYCCGYPYLSEGNISAYKNNMKKILNSIKDIDYENIICTCDSCYYNLLKASEYCSINENILKKIISFDKFLEINKYQIPDCSQINYFKPLVRNNGIYTNQNINVVNSKGLCSFMENFLILKYSKRLKKFINTVFNSVDFKSEEIITTCQLTKWGLIKNQSANNIVEVLSYAEFIECERKKKKHID